MRALLTTIYRGWLFVLCLAGGALCWLCTTVAVFFWGLAVLVCWGASRVIGLFQVTGGHLPRGPLWPQVWEDSGELPPSGPDGGQNPEP